MKTQLYKLGRKTLPCVFYKTVRLGNKTHRNPRWGYTEKEKKEALEHANAEMELKSSHNERKNT